MLKLVIFVIFMVAVVFAGVVPNKNPSSVVKSEEKDKAETSSDGVKSVPLTTNSRSTSTVSHQHPSSIENNSKNSAKNNNNKENVHVLESSSSTSEKKTQIDTKLEKIKDEKSALLKNPINEADPRSKPERVENAAAKPVRERAEVKDAAPKIVQKAPSETDVKEKPKERITQ